MKNFTIKKSNTFEAHQLEELYNDADWVNYTNDMGRLNRAVKNSLLVLGCWNQDELIGIIRIVGDGETIIYIQDIIVKKQFKRNGIGSKLLEAALEEFNDVRQIVLLTDDSPETRGFYESNGFSSCDKGSLVSFVKFRKSLV